MVERLEASSAETANVADLDVASLAALMNLFGTLRPLLLLK